MVSNLAAPQGKRVYSLNWPVYDSSQNTLTSLELGPSAILEVNGVGGKGKGYEMADMMLNYLISKCPSGGEDYNPTAWEYEYDPMSDLYYLTETYQDAFESLWSSQQVNPERFQAYYNEKSRDSVRQKFRRGDLRVIFYPTSIEGSGEISITNATRKFWRDLSTIQKEAATTIGYDESLWDREDAPYSPIDAGLKLKVSNYITPNAAFLYVQFISGFVVFVLVLIEIRLFLETLVVMGQFGIKSSSPLGILIVMLALFTYVAVPVMVLLTSLLVISESGTELDVVKDALALLFMLEINNYLHVATHRVDSHTSLNMLPCDASIRASTLSCFPNPILPRRVRTYVHTQQQCDRQI